MTTRRFKAPLRAVLSVMGLACACVSHASQTQENVPETSRSLWGDKTTVAVGLGTIVSPRYMGSQQTHALLLPTLSLSRGIFFADSTRGIGAEYMNDSGFYISSALAYDPGRKDHDSSWRAGSDRLRGMGDVTGATTADLLLSQAITPWLAVSGEAEFCVAGYQRGNRYRFGLESTLFNSSTDTVTLGVNAHMGDGRYNRTYFGVSEQQERTSRFERFDAKSGIYAYSTSLDWQHSFNAHWTLLMGANLMAFSDRARHSPIVESGTGAAGFAMLDYTF